MSSVGLNSTINSISDLKSEFFKNKPDLPDNVISLRDFQEGNFEIKPGETFAIRIPGVPVIPNPMPSGYDVSLDVDSNIEFVDKVHDFNPYLCGSTSPTYYIFKAPEEGKFDPGDIKIKPNYPFDNLKIQDLFKSSFDTLSKAADKVKTFVSLDLD